MKPREAHRSWCPSSLVLLSVMLQLLLVDGLSFPRQPAAKCVDGLASKHSAVLASNDQLTEQLHTPLVLKATFARGFLVEDHTSFKLVRLNASGEVYCLHQAGTAPPALGTLPAGAKVFSVPLSSISVVDASAVAYMAELGVLQHIKYVAEMVSDPCMQKLALPTSQSGCGRKAAAPGEAAGDMLPERQAREVAAVWLDAAADAGSPVWGGAVAFSARAEASPLARAEWLKFAALFFGKELHASQRFGSILGAYNEVRDAAARHVAVRSSTRPLVAWTAATERGEVELLLGPYEAHLTQDAGGQALQLAAVEAAAAAAGARLSCRAAGERADAAPCTTRSAVAVLNASSPEGGVALLQLLSQADVVVDSTPWLGPTPPTLTDLLAAYALPPSAATTLPAAVHQRVFRPDARLTLPTASGSPALLDWHHTATARPDLALQDLAAALHPGSTLAAAAAPAFLRNVAHPLRRDGAGWVGVSVARPQQCVLLHGCTMQPQPPCPYVYRDPSSGQLQFNTASRCPPSPTPTALATAAAAPPASYSAHAGNTSAATPDNGAAALRPLLLVFFMIVALIEGLIHLF